MMDIQQAKKIKQQQLKKIEKAVMQNGKVSVKEYDEIMKMVTILFQNGFRAMATNIRERLDHYKN